VISSSYSLFSGIIESFRTVVITLQFECYDFEPKHYFKFLKPLVGVLVGDGGEV
tara:strand:- start:1138 stop:1299 length:162 start_codon:yes stop_codon:yes gene_type:complete